MKQIGFHRNVLSMLGYWVKSEPIMLILEYVPRGDLLQWLRNKRQQVRNTHLLCLGNISLLVHYPMASSNKRVNDIPYHTIPYHTIAGNNFGEKEFPVIVGMQNVVC